jgi:hypothetical protein
MFIINIAFIYMQLKVIIIIVIIILILLYSKSEQFVNEPVRYFVFDSNKPGPMIGILAGIHGNEPAASIELFNLINSGWFKTIKNGSVRIIPNANPVGLALGIRRDGLFKGIIDADDGDLNRSFHEPIDNATIKSIIQFLEPCDIVIDFHEGWGFHQIQKASMGSTLMGNDDLSSNVIKKILIDLNSSQLMKALMKTDPRKAFVELDKKGACDIANTFSCYKKNLNQSHILVETSGQNNVQHMIIRRQQVCIILNSLLRQFSVI